MAHERRITYLMTLAHFTNDTFSLAIAPLLLFIKPEFHLSYTMAGIVVTVPLFISAIMQTPMGYLAERHGIYRRVLLGGFIALITGFLMLSVVRDYILLLLVSVIIGFGLSTYHPMGISILSYVHGNKKGRAIGIHGSGGSLATIVAPAIVASIGSLYGWRTSVLVIAILGTVVVILLYLFVTIQPPGVEHRNFIASITSVAIVFAIVSSIMTIFTRGYTAFLPLFMKTIVSSDLLAGMMTSFILLPGIIAQPIGGYLSERYSRKWIMVTAFVMVGVLMPLAVHLPSMVSIAVLLVISFIMYLSVPVKYSYATDIGGGVAVNIALLFGTGMAFASLSPVLIGFLIDNYGFTTAFSLISIFAFAGSALMLKLPDK